MSSFSKKVVAGLVVAISFNVPNLLADHLVDDRIKSEDATTKDSSSSYNYEDTNKQQGGIRELLEAIQYYTPNANSIMPFIEPNDNLDEHEEDGVTSTNFIQNFMQQRVEFIRYLIGVTEMERDKRLQQNDQ